MSKMEVILSTTFFYSLHLYGGILLMFGEKLLRTRTLNMYFRSLMKYPLLMISLNSFCFSLS